MQIRKPENGGTLFRSNEKKNEGKQLNKIEGRFAERKQKMKSIQTKMLKC